MSAGPPEPWSYTRNQRYGIVLLLAFIAGAYFLGRYLIARQPPYPATDDSALFAAARKLRRQTEVPPDDRPTIEHFRFNPNTVSSEDLQRLGLSFRQAASWIRFRDKRPFRSVEDIGRLYVLQPAQATTLMALADLPGAAPANLAPSVPSAPVTTEIFPFDPNTLSPDSLALLGFSEREASALVRYRSYRPLTFRQPEDLLRVGALDSNRVNELLEYVRIALPTDPAPAAAPDGKPAAPVLASVDVNEASLEDWHTLPGIGAYRAASIVKFRESLGGFARLDQVGTTYGLPDSTFRKIRPYLKHSPPARTLYVNRLDAASLARHPYLKRSTAEIIVRYRDNHGPFASAEELKKVRALSTETLDALLPYLNFDR